MSEGFGFIWKGNGTYSDMDDATWTALEPLAVGEVLPGVKSETFNVSLKKDRLVALHAVERMANRRLYDWEEKWLQSFWDDIESQ